jgi:archaeosine-15-forming tRNA-guanine transglycosylase
MADLALDQMTEGKPVRIEKDGKSICVARVGDEVFAMQILAHTQMHHCLKEMSPVSRLNAGSMELSSIYAPEKR